MKPARKEVKEEGSSDTPLTGTRVRADSLPTKKAKEIVLVIEKESYSRDFLNLFGNSEDIVAMKVNGVTQNLNTKLYDKCKVRMSPIYKNSLKGEAMIRRSLVFLMAKAMKFLFPDHESWHVEHQLANAYFCDFNDSRTVKKEFLEALKAKMLEFAKQRLAIYEDLLFHKDAVDYFRENKLEYSLRLISSVNNQLIPVHVCEGFMLMHQRPLVANTKFLTEFDLRIEPHGWALEFKFSEPRYKVYYQAKEMSEKGVIKINKERNDFAKSIKCECVGDINMKIAEKKIEEFIMLNNTFQDMVMNSLIKKIDLLRVERGVRLILIAGPSAAGKTTFAKKVGWNLQCRGYSCYTLSVDHYYVNREDNPVDENGEYDFECLEALRIPKLNSDLNALFNGEEVWIPHFDMKIGKYNDYGEKMKIEEGSFLIMEGIHCLNDRLTPNIDKNMKYKVFIGPFTPINLDDHNYISNKIIRLMRRAVRDKMHRNHSIQDTLKRWPSVMRGEHLYIFPFMKEADWIFNSALDYEINVLKPYVKPLLKGVKSNCEFFDRCRELLKFLENFETIPYKYVPLDSLLQEFLRGHWSN